MEILHRHELPKLLDFYSLPSSAVEVGTAEGRFSKQLLDGGVGLLYLVDIWENVPFIDGCASFEDEWHNDNYKQVMSQFGNDERVIILKGFSHKQAHYVRDGSLGLAYIDCDHSYQGTKSDIKVWWPKLVSGGIMAFHDYANLAYGVNRAVIEFVQGEGNVNVIKEDGGVDNIGAWIRKP